MYTYIAREIGKIDYPPRTYPTGEVMPVINGLRVGVFRVENGQEEQIGEFERNFWALADTFCHFIKDGKDYALYSPEYTTTRLMELPSCKDIGGEEPSGSGFCPVEFFVPTYVETEFVDWKGTSHRSRHNNSNLEELVSSKAFTIVTPLQFYPFGFVLGCIWGDDATWKIQYLDLSQAEQGILKREERFGYIAVRKDVSLRDAIDMGGYDPTTPSYTEGCNHRITITICQQFDLRDGKAGSLIDCS